MAKQQEPQGVEAIRHVRRLLAQWLADEGDPRKTVASILRLTEGIEDELRRASTGKSSTPHPATRDYKTLRYSVDKTPAGEVLTEHRTTGGSPPFRVSKAIYDAAAEVLADADKALKFPEIIEAVGVRTGATPGDFQVRACLRFWLLHRPPLVTRARSEYRSVSQQTFRSEARKAWSARVKTAQ